MLIKAKRYIESTPSLKIVSGKTTELGIPVSRQIRAYSRRSGILLCQTKSNTAGNYKFYLPRDSAYILVAIDSSKKFNAVIQDNVVPV